MQNQKGTLLLSFITALCVVNVSGPQYVFPIYGPSLAKHFHWSSIENSMVSTAVFVGVSFSSPLCAWLAVYLGCKKTLVISSFISLSAMFLLVETYVGYLSSNYILCSFYLLCIGAASAASCLCAFDSQAYNFKSCQGLSLGITSASLGISGLLFSQINDKFFRSKDGDNTFGFLIFFGCTATFVTLLGSFILGPISDIKHDHPSIRHPITQTKPVNYASTDASIHSFSTSSTWYEGDSIDSKPSLSSNVMSGTNSIQIEDDAEMNISGCAVLLTPIGFSLCLSLLVILGLGYVYLTNIESILVSLSADGISSSEIQHLRNLHLSIFSVSNCLSRVLFGALSDLVRERAGIHRIWFIWFAAFSFMITMVSLTAFAPDGKGLLLYSIVIAVIYGTSFGIGPVIISELVIKDFVKTWGWIMCAPAIGSQLYNFLFGFVYDKELKHQTGKK
ncbi:hypothetical protein G6F37_004213 [Rhizopus arrhizus]|nr:hypothetical protein G6F38_000973 [Rhizopus arrhizus]KAG1160199.1 hypothetical protein G6F37_004213 [Rhizopus arrhizus]